MRWHDVWLAVGDALEADGDVMTVVGERIYLAGEREFELPAIVATLIVDTEDERFAPVDFQFDLLTRSMGQMVVLEAAVRRLFTHDVDVTVGGLRMWSQFLTGRSLRGPEDDEFFRRSLDFRFTPIRSRYVRVMAES